MDVRGRLAKNLKTYRLKANMSQEELAHQSNLERGYISGIERGIRNPTVLVLQQISKVLQIHEADLLQDPPVVGTAAIRKSRQNPGGDKGRCAKAV